jgi:hypothetical protein
MINVLVIHYLDGRYTSIVRFEDHRNALRARFATESAFNKTFVEPMVEILALSSYSLETMKKTHSKYFHPNTVYKGFPGE